jgi:hypothetical protein
METYRDSFGGDAGEEIIILNLKFRNIKKKKYKVKAPLGITINLFQIDAVAVMSSKISCDKLLIDQPFLRILLISQ